MKESIAIIIAQKIFGTNEIDISIENSEIVLTVNVREGLENSPEEVSKKTKLFNDIIIGINTDVTLIIKFNK